MKCSDARSQLTAYLDGELEGDRGSAVRGHLRGCGACRSAAAEEAALRDELRALPPLDPPASLWAGV
jgi:anti-sigma factor RsiW